jgi:hypothetical protein
VQIPIAFLVLAALLAFGGAALLVLCLKRLSALTANDRTSPEKTQSGLVGPSQVSMGDGSDPTSGLVRLA